MKVFKRVLIKIIILLCVIGIFGGGAACWQAYRQSTPGYAIETYLSKLIDGSSDKAYLLLDQSEDAAMTAAEYAKAAEAKKYSLYSEYNLYELEKRRDNDGQEYVDYRAEFLDAAQSVQLEENFTVKKQSEAVLGIFDKWNVLSGHCMVKDFLLTVPTDAEVYLNGVPADTSWITRDGIPLSYDCYKIPSLLPGSVSLVMRHPVFESVNVTLDTQSQSADYSSELTMKSSAQDELKELAVQALKALYKSAASEKTDELKEKFADCLKDAEKLSKNQAEEFHREDAIFKSAAISKFDAKFGDAVFTEEKNGAITTELSFSYHYDVREEITAETGEYYEDGSAIMDTQTKTLSGDETAKFVMAYYENAWHIESAELKVIPER